jgi:hypothetical protein
MISNGGSSCSSGTSNAWGDREIHEALPWQALNPISNGWWR